MPYETLREPPEIIRANINRYRKMLVGNTKSRPQQQMIEHLLRTAEETLVRMTATPE
jgi:hypothetical protein